MSRLFWKILLTFWLSSLLLMAAANLPSLLQQWRLAGLEAHVVSTPISIVTVKAAATTFQYGGLEALRAMLSEQKREAPQEMQVYALDAKDQELLGRTVDKETRDRVQQLADTKMPFPFIRTVESGEFRLVLFAPWSGQFPTFNQANHWHPNPKHLNDLLLFCALILAGLLASLLLAWNFSHPVQQLKQAFVALASGNLDTRLNPTISRRRDELADLGQAFDAMATQLQTLVKAREQLLTAQQTLLHDVSHELRAPLTRLQMSIYLSWQQPETTETNLNRIEQEADRLERLVTEVLEFSRLEAADAYPQDDCVDVSVLLETLTESVGFEAKAAGCSLCLQRPPPTESCLLKGNAELLYRALENVLRNAVRYTRLGTMVTIQLLTEADHNLMEIQMTDQGPGVPIEHLDSMFQPFRRFTSTSDNATPTGYGLGLAIARKAIEFHGGTITAHNHDQAGGGLQVVIRLPKEMVVISPES